MSAPLLPMVWQALDHTGRPVASFWNREDAFKFARYALRRPGYAQAVML